MKVILTNSTMAFRKAKPLNYVTPISIRIAITSIQLSKTYGLCSWYDEGSSNTMNAAVYSLTSGKTYKIRSWCNNFESDAAVKYPAYVVFDHNPIDGNKKYSSYAVGTTQEPSLAYTESTFTPSSNCYVVIGASGTDSTANGNWYIAEM